jgi:aminopeptidase N
LLSAGTSRAQAPSDPYAITALELEVDIAPALHQLKATARLELQAHEPLASLTLQLNRNLKVDRVRGSDRKTVPFERPPQSETLRADLPQPVAAGQSFSLEIDYQGAFDPALRPARGRLLAAIAPGNSYLLPAARWFPQGANLWQRLAMALTVIVPQEETALATGLAEPPTTTTAGKTRYRFRTAGPTLPGTLVVGRFEKITPTTAGPVTFYLRSVPDTTATANAEKFSDILGFFSDKFRPLDSFSLAVVETLDPSWEAYSAPGLLLLPTHQWSASLNPRLLARELALEWWGAGPSPATANDAWLSAGLARYSEALYFEHSASEGALRTALEDLTIAALVDESAAPIANASELTPGSPEYDSVVRDKGAMVFHMLRRVLGDQTFFQLLQSYAERFSKRSAALTDFEHLAEEVSGKSLDYFFGEWVRSTGIPEFQLTWVLKRTQKGFRLDGTISQQLEIFRMPVEIRFQTEGPPVTSAIEVTGLSTEFFVESFGRPLSHTIQIDPDFHVLKYTPDLRLRVAIRRGESLFERGQYLEAMREYQKAIEVKRTSSLAHYRMGETFFEQRNYQAAANAFREAINGDLEPKWTLVWGHIFLGKIFDITGQRERAINEYRRAVESGDDTQGALAEAQKYLQEPYRREARTIERIEQIERR